MPWFGYQLFNGNSLIGARRQTYSPHLLTSRSAPRWFDEAPVPVAAKATAGEKAANTESSPAGTPPGIRSPGAIYHFLLPDSGMAHYTDKVAKQLYPADFARLKAWRSQLTRPLDRIDIARLQQLSASIDSLWAEHAQALARDRAATEDPLSIWPHRDAANAGDAPRPLSRSEKDATRKRGLLNDDGDLATPYRRLKLVMDYWCALWFWPITGSSHSRKSSGKTSPATGPATARCAATTPAAWHWSRSTCWWPWLSA